MEIPFNNDKLINLFYDCIVKLSVPKKNATATGTGFFVAPGYILTCAHVVGDLRENIFCKREINVRWKKKENYTQAKVAEWFPEIDVALLKFKPNGEGPPAVKLGRDIKLHDNLFTFGYHKEFPDGRPVTSVCEGKIPEDPPLFAFKFTNIKPGMSGGPVLNLRTKHVCGILKQTFDRSSFSGGSGIFTRTVFKKIPAIRDLQDQFHQNDHRWQETYQNTSLPDIRKKVKTKIAEILKKKKITYLRFFLCKELGKIPKTTTPIQITETLVSLEVLMAIAQLLKARNKAKTYMHAKDEDKKKINSVVTGARDILGWLVLLSADHQWIKAHADDIMLKKYPGAIELPAGTETAIEIYHAIKNKRSAQFGKTGMEIFSRWKMPTIGSHSLEAGFDSGDVTLEIKKMLYAFISNIFGVDEISEVQNTPDWNDKINSHLEHWKDMNEDRYLLVKRSNTSHPLNQEDIYQDLLKDLKDLQVVYQKSCGQSPILNVSETKLETKLLYLFDEKQTG